MVQNFLVDIIRKGLNQRNNGKFKCSHSKYGIFCANCGFKMDPKIQSVHYPDKLQSIGLDYLQTGYKDDNDRGPQ